MNTEKQTALQRLHDDIRRAVEKIEDNDDEIVHIVFTYDANSEFKLYINGEHNGYRRGIGNNEDINHCFMVYNECSSHNDILGCFGCLNIYIVHIFEPSNEEFRIQ